MSLRRNSVTPKSLAAGRSNALKSTGPRTARGKARVCLNALKDGRHAVLAARAPRLRQRLIEAGHTEEEAVYGAIRSRIAQASPIQGPEARRQIDQLALLAWCLAWRTHSPELKLKSPELSVINKLWVSTECRLKPRRFSIIDPWRRAGLVFWRQRRHRPIGRRAGWQPGSTKIAPESSNNAPESSDKGLAAALELVTTLLHYRARHEEAPRQVYENAIRCRLYRLAKPGALERDRYKVLANGNPDPALQHSKDFKSDERATWPRSRESWGAPNSC